MLRGRDRRGPARALPLAVGAATIAAAVAVGEALQASGRRLWLGAPPLTGGLRLRVTWGLAALAAAGVAGVMWLPRAAGALRWRRLLWLAAGLATLWAAGFALADGAAGFVDPPTASVDYRITALEVDGWLDFLDHFVERIGSYPGHGFSHPPGMALLLAGLFDMGATSPWWQAWLQLLAFGAAVPAVLLASREVADQTIARRAAPFLVLAPWAFSANAADSVFLAVGAWGTASLVRATGRDGTAAAMIFAALAGAAFGALALLTYAGPLFALVGVGVVVARRRWSVLAVAGGVALGFLLLLAWAGFDWVEALRAARPLIAASVARFRPYPYSLLSNLAALLIVLGPAVWVGVARLRDRPTWLLVGAALALVAVADVSGLSKGETERIWLPLMPWIALATASLDRQRPWLGVQVGWAVVLQALIRSPW